MTERINCFHSKLFRRGIVVAFGVCLASVSLVSGAAASGAKPATVHAAEATLKVAYVPKLQGIKVFNIAYSCLQKDAKSLNLQVTQEAPATADAQEQVNIF